MCVMLWNEGCLCVRAAYRLGDMRMRWFQGLIVVLVVAFVAVLAAACASAPADGGGYPTINAEGHPPPTVCKLAACSSDTDCASCPDDKTQCDLASSACVAGPGSSPSGSPTASASCPTDAQGTPTISCNADGDCAACDPMHQICDGSLHRCVSCTATEVSKCGPTAQCENDRCVPKCPATCATDNDCGSCGAPGHEAHACNAGTCAACSATYACPAGATCDPKGVCVTKCGTDGDGACYADSDCGGCGQSPTCHFPINGGAGKCGATATGCSDLGNGAAVLPTPFNQVTNTCSTDQDCSGVGVQYNVGKLLRDLSGISQIKDADVFYGMNVCAAVTVGTGDQSLSCGVCVPCRTDSDCGTINVDQVASQALGPLGGFAATLVLDEIFGTRDHQIHMYCQDVAAGYGACVPCPSLFDTCGAN